MNRGKGMLPNETEIDYGARIARIKSDAWLLKKYMDRLKAEKLKTDDIKWP